MYVLPYLFVKQETLIYNERIKARQKLFQFEILLNFYASMILLIKSKTAYFTPPIHLRNSGTINISNTPKTTDANPILLNMSA